MDPDLLRRLILAITPSERQAILLVLARQHPDDVENLVMHLVDTRYAGIDILVDPGRVIRDGGLETAHTGGCSLGRYCTCGSV
jgi:hypothetical protein